MTIKMKCPFRRNSAVSQETARLRKQLLKLKPDEAYILKDHKQQAQVYGHAKLLGIKIFTRKINGKGIGVWRDFAEKGGELKMKGKKKGKGKCK